MDGCRWPNAGRSDVGARPVSSRVPNGSLSLRALKIGRYQLGAYSLGTLTYLTFCKPKQTPPTHLHHWFFTIVRLRVIPSVFSWVIASSGTWDRCGCGFLVSLWWLPPPRWLGAAKELRHVLVIIHGRLRWLWGVLYLTRRRAER
jgi:hypothetical protein